MAFDPYQGPPDSQLLLQLLLDPGSSLHVGEFASLLDRCLAVYRHSRSNFPH